MTTPAHTGDLVPPGGTADQVLTKQSGLDGDTAWGDAPSGASGPFDPTKKETFSGTSTVSGGTAYLPWTKQGGADLLDLTDPTHPLVIAAGDYAFNIQVTGPQGVNDPTKHVWMGLDCDAAGDDAYDDANWPAVGSGNGDPSGHMTVVYYMPAGAVVTVQAVTGQDGDFRLEGSVRQLSGAS